MATSGGLIITKGLGKNAKACDGLITTRFSIYCKSVVAKKKGGGGGPYPAGKGAWNQFDSAEDIFKPVEIDHYDPKRIYTLKKEVTIKLNIGEIKMEKIFLVPKKRGEIIVNTINLINATRDRITITIGKIRKILHGITMKVSKLNRRKDK